MDLFDNPMIDSARQSMTKEQIKDYKIKGELMYNTIDYETGEVLETQSNELQNLLMAINSGLRYTDLDKDEMKLLEKYYSKEEVKELFD
jgi:hypothetical protein